MPLQQIPQNMMYYPNQMGQQQQQQPMCYPDTSSMMMMQQQQQQQQMCYPQQQQQQQQMCYPQHQSAGAMSMDPEAINHPVAYSLTEQFRHIVGSIVATACTPRGRSLLQSVMRLQHSDKVQTIFDEIVAEASVVMLDPNGCHVVRSIIEMLDEEQVRRLVLAMNEMTILNVATTSQYTRRILQSLFEKHKAENLTSIVDVLAAHALALATTQQGCIALMRVIERCSADQKEKLLASLNPALLDLATDPFGNYVVQSVLEHYKNDCVPAALKGHLLKLASNKFASNVMEKAFRFSSVEVRSELISELFDDSEALGVLVQDGFGNFVIQSVIDSCPNQTEFRRISETLRPLLHASPYGHKIESKLRNKKFNANGMCVANASQTAEKKTPRTSRPSIAEGDLPLSTERCSLSPTSLSTGCSFFQKKKWTFWQQKCIVPSTTANGIDSSFFLPFCASNLSLVVQFFSAFTLFCCCRELWGLEKKKIDPLRFVVNTKIATNTF